MKDLRLVIISTYEVTPSTDKDFNHGLPVGGECKGGQYIFLFNIGIIFFYFFVRHTRCQPG